MSNGDGHRDAEIRHEQAIIDRLYHRLDEVRDRVRYRLRRALDDPIAGTPGSVSEREALVNGHIDRLAELNGVDERLCFGRLDLASGERRYIGRIGLTDNTQSSLLVDWRAAAAEPFYRATAPHPMGVVRRRHISTDGRAVNSIDDDVLMVDELAESDLESVTGSDALLVSLNAARTGRMRDIVATIQSEQDEIIRSESAGVLVVEGGPGTGKSVVALHRVAYLLYSERNRIGRSGALVVGPSPHFMTYIDQVLPALGETGVVLKSLGDFIPGVIASQTDNTVAAGVKGQLTMIDVLRQAVESYQRVPSDPVDIDIDGRRLRLTPQDFAASIRRARESKRPHNEARQIYAKDALRRLARALAHATGTDSDDETLNDLVADLRDNRNVKREINLRWLPLEPERLLRRLLSDDALLRQCGSFLTDVQRAALLRDPHSGWTVSDIPLLDELHELLGEATAQPTTTPEFDAKGLAQARAALEYSGAAASMITPESYLRRFAGTDERAPLAERAELDRGWVYGHVVVDEAQELTQMQWRMVMRRTSTRSMTIVGDPAQASGPGAVGNWKLALEPYVQDRWRLRRLTVNYRTPANIMRLAERVHTLGNLPGRVPTSVREGEWPVMSVETEDMVTGLRELIHTTLSEVPGGTMAIVGRGETIDNLKAQHPDSDSAGEATTSWLRPEETKGLEFDTVILVEPAEWEPTSLAGQLYVALTRPTQKLAVVHTQPLPELLAAAIVGPDN